MNNWQREYFEYVPNFYMFVIANFIIKKQCSMNKIKLTRLIHRMIHRRLYLTVHRFQSFHFLFHKRKAFNKTVILLRFFGEHLLNTHTYINSFIVNQYILSLECWVSHYWRLYISIFLLTQSFCWFLIRECQIKIQIIQIFRKYWCIIQIIGTANKR